MSNQKITAEMPIEEIIKKYPDTMEVFAKHGLHCVGCQLAQFESLAAGAKAHSIDLTKLLTELNQATESPNEKEN